MPRTAWGEARRSQLESVLVTAGWQFVKQFTDSTLYKKNNHYIEVDEAGLFLFKKKEDGTWKRVTGLAGPDINESFSTERDNFILRFKRNGRIQLFDLRAE